MTVRGDNGIRNVPAGQANGHHSFKVLVIDRHHAFVTADLAGHRDPAVFVDGGTEDGLFLRQRQGMQQSFPADDPELLPAHVIDHGVFSGGV